MGGGRLPAPPCQVRVEPDSNNQRGCWNLPSHPAWPLATADRRGQRCPGHVPSAPWPVCPPEPRTSICQTRAGRPWALARWPSVGGWLTPSEEQPLRDAARPGCPGEGAPAPTRPGEDRRWLPRPRAPVRTGSRQRRRPREAGASAQGEATHRLSTATGRADAEPRRPVPRQWKGGAWGTCQGARPPRWYKSLGCKI